MAQNSLSILIRQTEDPWHILRYVPDLNAPPEFIAHSRIILPAETILPLTGEYLGVGNPEDTFYPLRGKGITRPLRHRQTNVPYIPWDHLSTYIKYDEELGRFMNVIEMKTADAQWNRCPAGPPQVPLAERCKELFSALRNQLLSACSNSSKEHTRAPSPMSDSESEEIYDSDAPSRGSAKTVSMRLVDVTPRRRQNRDGYIKITDDDD